MKKFALSVLSTMMLFSVSTVTGVSAAGDSNIVPEATDGGSGAAYYPGTSVQVRPGDILVTSSVSSAGYLGHAGIVVDYSGRVASIRGYGYYPEIMSISSWFTMYPKEKVVRYNNLTAAQKAANWAYNYVVTHPTTPYDIKSLYYTGSTYCSKIVWNAYANGANVFLPYTSDPLTGYTASVPYQLLNTPNSSQVYSNFSL